MSIAELRFVLPADVVIEPVATLPQELREQVDHADGDCAVTRPRSRSNSSIVDARTAALLERFRAPETIVGAVIAYSRATGVDPRATLDDAFAVLSGFVNEGLLVSSESELAEPIAASLEAGAQVGELTLVEPLQVLADVEVHLVRAADGEPAALKLARAGAGRHVGATLAHEAAVLRQLDGSVAPRLLAVGEHDERPYLALSWCAGIDLHGAATEARALGAAGRAPLLALAERVLSAYALLHERELLHGDVHPRNAISGPDGSVTLIDFGLATRPAAPGSVHAGLRGGVDFFLDPETAAARLARGATPALSPAGEQYSLGALLQLLLTGAHTHDFSLEPEQMLRQLVEQPPVPFSRHDAGDLAAVERVVGRALAKQPEERFASTRALLDAFRQAAAEDLSRPRAAPPRRAEQAAARQLVDDVLGRLAVPGPLYDGGLAAPTASAMNGGAGFAYALLRIARARGDDALTAAADLWSTQAQLSAGTHDAFWNEELEIVPEKFGESSFYHHAAGVHAVQALVAEARGDDAALLFALDGFLTAASDPCDQLDVTFGRAGLLLGSALLLDALPAALDAEPLLALGDRLAASLWEEVAAAPPATLGAAHGEAGFLFALLRWSEASGAAPPPALAQRLELLATLALPSGRGLRWQPEAGAGGIARSGLESSWCNGAAGWVHLWAAAHRRDGDERFARLAERAAWTAYEGAAASVSDLCCGFAGRAYALLAVHELTGEQVWFARARLLGDAAAAGIGASALRRDSLYKGEIGVALLLAELDAAEPAGMPLFAADRRPAVTRPAR
ncbi:lanthionine synthetase LanC family protein [Conexibacter stalactiti]|uniref:Lanthionine synthetase LanC family protein n=1 Tax=Conexibacter stalactiti TaxID=1940611 RepID=A0ABU4HSU6_9ACTN|nr:lanthionine synthetase LanC family protein [Conexibacter stalactiti]MDW5595747.1 lanthionine synthetase LanC family protein [Conexibacter stalactiti]MEC5036389.1 lanthionine synthetase LanC family protein [Conexibacter stalactiti]